MLKPLCPVCRLPLAMEKTVWHCTNGHSFDVARQGYVNLLTVQQRHSLHPGDTRDMVAARRDFLDKGYYAPIAQELRRLLTVHAPKAERMLDVGCGEGYYLSQLPEVPERWGIDISKDAVRFAAAREKGARFLTATATHLPFADGVFDGLLSMFAMTAAQEFSRVLRSGGIFIQVLAGENHLLGLKRIIYPEILHKDKQLQPKLDGFCLLDSETLRFTFSLHENADVQRLLSMTPHFWRISKQGAQALAETMELTDSAEVVFNVYAAL